jgi:integrase
VHAGQDRQRKRGGFRLEAEAQTELTKMLSAVDVGLAVPPDRLAVRTYVAGWLDHLEHVVGRKPSTVAGYAGYLRRYVDGPLGGMRMQRVTASDVDGVYRGMAEHGLSARTIRQLHAILRKAFGDAAKQGVVAVNVIERTSPPSTTAAKAPTFATWTFDELGGFLEFIQGRVRAEAIEFAALTGVRRGEVCGLRWGDVDLVSGLATVAHTVADVDGVLIPGDTKSHRSRPVGLDAGLVAMLRRHRKAQLEWRLNVGQYWIDHDLAFPAPDGDYMKPLTLTQQFDRLVEKSAAPRIRFHDLRHTHGTLLIQSGHDAKLVSEQLGHSTVAFTLDRYVHHTPKQQIEAANDFASRLAGR